MADLTLRKDDNGNTLVVTVQNTETVIPLSADEIQRQIKEHCDVVTQLQKQLEVVKTFEAGSDEEVVATLPDVLAKPIIDDTALKSIDQGAVAEAIKA